MTGGERLVGLRLDYVVGPLEESHAGQLLVDDEQSPRRFRAKPALRSSWTLPPAQIPRATVGGGQLSWLRGQCPRTWPPSRGRRRQDGAMQVGSPQRGCSAQGPAVPGRRTCDQSRNEARSLLPGTPLLNVVPAGASRP
jgi:hypothetical protein